MCSPLDTYLQSYVRNIAMMPKCSERSDAIEDLAEFYAEHQVVREFLSNLSSKDIGTKIFNTDSENTPSNSVRCSGASSHLEELRCINVH